MSSKSLIEQVRNAGIVGQGGAGFPTHVKLDAEVDIVIANGCECEPLLATDRQIMLDWGTDVVHGLRLAMQATGAVRGVVAIKRKHGDLVRWFSEHLEDPCLSLTTLDNFYPAGDEQVLIREVTGRYVAPLSLPKEAGCVVCNVGTLKSIADAEKGLPVTHKVVTVTGAVAHPSVFTVPVGCSVGDCIDHCGGPSIADAVAVLGGPMMGRVLDDVAAMRSEPISKTLGGIILVPRGHHLHQTARQTLEVMRRRAASACIQCRFCTDLCPRYLLGQPFETHRVMRAFAHAAELTSEAGKQALLCCGCGVCEQVACPMGLSPCTINAHIKKALAASRVSYDGQRAECSQNSAWRSARRLPVSRLASRIGISEYMGITPQARPGPTPERVTIPLRQHIGAPAIPVCAVGERVSAGQVIGIIPENALGAVVHASISGDIERVDTAVCIRRSDHA